MTRSDSTGQDTYGNSASPTDHDRGAAEVIGAVMLVAVTVLAVSALGIWMLDQQPTQSPPDVSFDLNTQPGSSNVTLTHAGGADVNTSRLTVLVAGSEANPAYSATVLSAGHTISVEASSGDTVALVYELDGGGTATLFRTEVP